MSVCHWLAGVTLGLVVFAAPASAEDLMPMDLTGVDPELVEGMFGDWIIADQSGEKRCAVTLSQETTIGGMVVEVDPACPSVFPVMADVAAWRMMEGWTIDLVDPLRHRLIRFSTPDDAYLAFPETDGIFTILKP